MEFSKNLRGTFSKGKRIKITLVDYGMGNIASVKNAFTYLGCEVQVTQYASDLRKAQLIVLPGVGAFGDAMKNLKKFKLIDEMNREVIEKQTPFIGICLGMQLLADESTENGTHQGLGWLPGQVIQFDIDSSLRVPHIGWNEIICKKDDSLFQNCNKDLDFYFVHSYWFKCSQSKHVHTTSNYGIEFTASVKKDNIFATQFHPERSHYNGLTILKNHLKSL
jgi:imidazole glycerol-phosphate synthase subunit HisH